eukprot:gene26586-17175_t
MALIALSTVPVMGALSARHDRVQQLNASKYAMMLMELEEPVTAQGVQQLKADKYVSRLMELEEPFAAQGVQQLKADKYESRLMELEEQVAAHGSVKESASSDTAAANRYESSLNETAPPTLESASSDTAAANRAKKVSSMLDAKKDRQELRAC